MTFSFLLDDGTYLTQKLIMVTMSPSLSSMLCTACSTIHHMLTILLPGVKTIMVEQAVRMICQEGNVTMMETQSIMMETILSLPARGLQEEEIIHSLCLPSSYMSGTGMQSLQATCELTENPSVRRFPVING